MNATGTSGIETLLADFLSKRISAKDFCAAFENAWNFEVDKTSIPFDKRAELDRLFDEVVLFSPFPRQTWEYPAYRDADEIFRSAEKALRVMGLPS